MDSLLSLTPKPYGILGKFLSYVSALYDHLYLGSLGLKIHDLFL